jgi:ring-1,2-phenylacetyl-CoA epoxidase subunit PaaB
MALQTARDVFVRRPACHSLWVVPAAEVVTRSGEQWDAQSQVADKEGAAKPYLIFARPNQRDPHQYRSRLDAPSPAAALRQYYELDPDSARLGAWAVPVDSLTSSREDDAEAWFQPAEAKAYRHGSFYHPDELLRRLRHEGEE